METSRGEYPKTFESENKKINEKNQMKPHDDAN